MTNPDTLNTLFDQALSELPEEFKVPLPHAWRQFVEFVQSLTDSQNKFTPACVTWLQEHMHELVKVWTCSEFVMQFCARHYEEFLQLIRDGDFDRNYPLDEYARRAGGIDAGVNEEGFMQALRLFRNREMVRIAWRDIAGKAEFNTTIGELSALADACIQRAYQYAYKVQSEKFGTAQHADGTPQHLVIIAMGKLGAEELNFSSDVDLIFTFPAAGDTRGGPRSVSHEEFFTHVARQLIRLLDARTADGFVFRVDMRLRPFGNSGPLVSSFAALEAYYQTHGREWERYALIKARALTGDAADVQELYSFLRPFVFRRYLDYGVYDELRDMKQRIVTEVSRKGLDHNIKLGAGGIREIEFVGQAFQLIRGGRDKALQQRQILKVLDHLAAKSQLPPYAVSELKAAYVFLRNTEHRLQQFADQQTHELPQQPHQCTRLALAMGFDQWPAFALVLQTHRNKVRGYFDLVFSAPQISSDENTELSQSPMAQVWLGLLDEPSALQQLASHGFDAEAALTIIKGLRNSSAVRSLSKRGSARMDVLMPLLIAAVLQHENATQTLQRVLQLVQAVARRTSYLALLAENPVVLSQVVRLCAASPWFAHQLSQYPILLDELLDARTLYKPPTRAQLAADLQSRIQQTDTDDLEAQMDVLRHFKQSNVLRVAAADLVNAIPLMVVSDHLTYIAEVVLQQVLALAWQTLHAKHGVPSGTSNQAEHSAFAVIAYGKLGGIELSYGSDLDLVFLYDTDPAGETNGQKPISVPVFYSRLGQRMIHLLTALTAAGTVYDVDMRLRPSGASGLLVSHIASFADYQAKSAWIWEHQALVRARPVAGDAKVAGQFVDIRKRVLCVTRDNDALRVEVVDMRERLRAESAKNHHSVFDLKQGSGGIADIEFMVQYMALSAAARFPDLIDFTDNVRILDAIAAAGLMQADEVRTLADIYRQFRDQVHKLALQEQPAVVEQTQYVEERNAVQAIWRKYMAVEA